MFSLSTRPTSTKDNKFGYVIGGGDTCQAGSRPGHHQHFLRNFFVAKKIRKL